MNENKTSEPVEEKVGILGVMASVVSAMFGVRGSKAHARDFSNGKPSAYIVVGLVFTALFVGTLVGIVVLVLRLSGV